VQSWIGAPPAWLEVSTVTPGDDPAFRSLDKGEKATLTLGLSLAADLILIDDRKGAAVARQKGFEIMGTLGVLTLAARRGLIDLVAAIERLQGTNFRRSEALLDALLKQHQDGKGSV
jgi:predicted nucleic acid-binding protein